MRHLLVTVIGKGIEPQQSNLLSQTTKIMGLGHEAAIFYAMLFQQTVTISYATMLTWWADLNIDVTHKEWDRICENTKRVQETFNLD